MLKKTLWACSSKGRIVLASGQIFRSDFRPQDEIFRPGMPFRPLDEQARNDFQIFIFLELRTHVFVSSFPWFTRHLIR